MGAYADRYKEKNNTTCQHPDAVAQCKPQQTEAAALQQRPYPQLAGNSSNVKQGSGYQAMADNFTGAVEPVQAKPIAKATVQLQAQPNRTGLPDKLKTGVESLSGMSLDHVKVHYNSDKPTQLSALAYAQGSDIHVGPGQEKHLPHEAWHVVQQAQGRVKPTMQMKEGVPVNDNSGLEREADLMGAKALGAVQTKTNKFTNVNRTNCGQGQTCQLKGPGMRARIIKKIESGEKLTARETKKKQEYNINAEAITGRLEQRRRAERTKIKRDKIDRIMNARVTPHPTVGISNRGAGGFSNDMGVFEKAKSKIKGTSLPPGIGPLPLGATKEDMLKQVARVQLRRPGKIDLSAVDGLFIPGGQDRDLKDGGLEKRSREPYEKRLVEEARRRGMPTMAVCGGSRALAKGFGATEQDITGKGSAGTHSKNIDVPAHPISLRDPNVKVAPDGTVREDLHTIVGGAASGRADGISAVNSTHKKTVSHVGGQIEPVHRIPATKERELMTSAWAPEGFPEAFETRYGAPIVGITSHPEAIHTDKNTRANLPKDARKWSDNLFKGFGQSMRAYRGKQNINAEILKPAMAREARPETYEKWQRKRNWQKLLKLGMINKFEARRMQADVATSRHQQNIDRKAGVRRDRSYNRAERL